jgi:carbonic anhydrase
MKAFVVFLFLLLIVACSSGGKDVPQETAHVVHWGYESDDGPARWGSMNEDWVLCAEGSSQSPIDLTGAEESHLPPIEIVMPAGQEAEVLNQGSVADALDNGHTIQINVPHGEALIVGGKTYALVQAHFHAPSEHTLDGEHYPMEMHFVHQASDGALAVLGVLIKEGAENQGIAPLWAHLPEGPGAETTVQIPAVFAQQVLPDVGSGFYHYDGSLTTPPCSEGVKWYVRLTPTEFSESQIAAFTAEYDHNNRPVQALNERTLYKDASPSVTVR